jgi:chorismate lyase
MHTGGWQPHLSLVEPNVTAMLRGWLTYSGSMTRRLKTTGKKISIQLLNQSWQTPVLHEQQSLDLVAKERANIREIIMMADDKPWLYARTVLPHSTAVGSARRLLRATTRPLGYYLFADPSITRGKFTFSRQALCQLHPYFNDVAKEQKVFGRRSTFYLQSRPLLLAEYFLPAMQEYLCQK